MNQHESVVGTGTLLLKGVVAVLLYFSVVYPKLFFPDPDPDPTLTLISDRDPDPDSNPDPDPGCL
jgi:hypothetical protein